jgi:hypothetical protein
MKLRTSSCKRVVFAGDTCTISPAGLEESQVANCRAEREAYEKSREFKSGQRFRAGIEGRISVLFRGRGMKRCPAEGRERFELWVAAAVLANNLMKIAALLAEPPSRRRKAA